MSQGDPLGNNTHQASVCWENALKEKSARCCLPHDLVLCLSSRPFREGGSRRRTVRPEGMKREVEEGSKKKERNDERQDKRLSGDAALFHLHMWMSLQIWVWLAMCRLTTSSTMIEQPSMSAAAQRGSKTPATAQAAAATGSARSQP